MAEKKEDTTSAKLDTFLSKNKKVLWIIVAVVVIAIVAFIVGEVVGKQAKLKNLAKVDEIQYVLTNDSAYLEEDELAARRAAALESLKAYTGKSGVVGLRANMLAADLEYQNKNWESAIEYYNAAASKNQKAYTAPLANYNAGVCYEQLNKLADAEASYKKATEVEDFVLLTHAKFSYGRVLEAEGKYSEAVAAYTDLNDKNPDDTWAKLAETRILALQAEGKAE